MEILEWIKNTKFQCDSTKEYFKYQELDLLWFTKTVKEDQKTTRYFENFSLVKHGASSKILKPNGKDWELNHRKLEKVLQENVVLFFTDILVGDSLHNKGNYEKVPDLKSWNELFRRLTVPYYEEARHRLKESKQMDDFLFLTEFELLQPKNLSNFIKSLK